MEKRKISTLFFDLDGTLLPMDQDAFVEGYFKLLAKKMIPYGYDPQELIKAVWAGTGAMVKNDGRVTNDVVFWEAFKKIFPETAERDMPLFEEFYKNEFDKAIAFSAPSPKVPEYIRELKAKGYRLVLATNPIFPEIATMKRISWAGLKPEDFEIVTVYENSSYAKPNPEYYVDLCKQLNIAPEEAVMVGNDVEEDMVAETVGMHVFLLTDCILNKKAIDISKYPQGGFDAYLKYLEELG